MRHDEAIAAQIGRFRVIGRLGTGGMAEILLCAIDGPSGFSRPVVVKRMLPRFAAQAEFRTMFVDEARIVSGLRHPNVVPVIELGQDGGELYLAMEYLDGESLDVVFRRLEQSGRRLPPSLAAHIVAEAAAGLHAAHELQDPTGEPLEIVHRDVSPHNVFVSYDGSVRVIDFGIATARQRETRTETGTVKGKFAYMSPEQIDAQSLDRRSDVFALGVVLWELLTFRRLFQRRNHLEIVKAICFSDSPRIETVDPTLPASLSDIVARALSRERDARQASAADLRRELVGAIHALPGGQEDPRDELAAIMRTTFVERVAEKRELLRRLAAGHGVASIPQAVAEADRDSEAIEIEVGPEGDPPPVVRLRSPRPDPAPSVARRSWARAAAIVIVLGGLAAAVGVGASMQRETAAPPSVVAPPIAAAPPQEVAPHRVHLRVETTPEGASVRVDGAERGTSPLDLELDARPGERAVDLSLDDHEPVTSHVAGDRDAELHVALARTPHRRETPIRAHAGSASPPATRTTIFRVD